MCGIFGYIGDKKASVICLDGLKKLEYRGYDSSGIAEVKDGKILICKEVGNISMLEKAIKTVNFESSTAIAHTRWATHGKPSKNNAHPQSDQYETLALVHNGVIENYAALKEDLIERKNVQFHSETDTEVIAQLIADDYYGDLIKAVQNSTNKLEGSYAIALIHKDYPDQIIACAKESPLIIGYSETTGELFIASDTNALFGHKLVVYFLVKGEMALLIKNAAPSFFDSHGCPIDKEGKYLEEIEKAISKENYEHFMLKEIFEQVQTIKNAFKDRFDAAEKTARFEELSIDTDDLKKIERILIIGCGSSYHAGLIASHMFETIAHLSTNAEIASEYRYRDAVLFPNTLVLALSQSGETADTIAAVRLLKEKNARIIALCNVQGSTLEREADATIFLHAGPEVAVASTKTFNSQLTVLYLLALLFGRLRGLDEDDGRLLFKRLYEIPAQVADLLNHTYIIEQIANKYAEFNDAFFLGRSILFPTALEGALKLKEIAYINANGYPAGEMKHGPIALLGPKVPVFGFCTNKKLHQKMMSNLMESKARAAPILVFGWKELEKDLLSVADDILWIPKTSDELAPILATVAAQLFAYYAAKKRGTAIDQPRNLAKSVTVE